MLAVEEPVVGGEDEDGLVELALALHLAVDPAETAIDAVERLQGAAVATLDRVGGVGVDGIAILNVPGLVGDVLLVEALRDRQRVGVEAVLVHRLGDGARGAARVAAGGGVRRVVVDLHEERIVLLHEALGPAGREVAGHLGDVVVVVESVVADLAVLGRLPVVIAALLELGEPEVPAGCDGGRPELALLVGVEEFADVRRVVAGVLEPGRKHVPLLLQVGVEVPQDAVVVPVLTRHQGRARGAAERRGDDVVAERGRARGDPAEQVRHRLGDHRRRSLVVGLDQHDVRLLHLLRRLFRLIGLVRFPACPAYRALRAGRTWRPGWPHPRSSRRRGAGRRRGRRRASRRARGAASGSDV